MGTRVKKKLDKTYRKAREQSLPIALQDMRLILLADQHRGGKDGADDFARCERAYVAALRYYYQAGHRLAVLGDAEELWERRPEVVMDTYASIFALENRFHEDGRYWRLVGNHDDQWYFPAEVDKYLGRFFNALTVWDGLVLSVTTDGERIGDIFLAHGHQGTFWSDYLSWLSRRVVRYLWRPFQRLTGYKSTTPSRDWRLRGKHDQEMHNWAVDQKGIILVAGHTHKTVFPPSDRPARLASEIKSLETDPGATDQLAEKRAELRFLQEVVQPCYFNAGCCSYSDGTITGIEIADGAIKLVRWSGGNVQPQVLAAVDLRAVFNQVRDRGALMALKHG